MLQKDIAAGARVFSPGTGFAGTFPAGFAQLQVGRAGIAFGRRTPFNLPAGAVVEQFLDAGDADPLVVDQFAQALKPLNVVVRQIAILFAPGGCEDPFKFVPADGPRVNAENFGGDAQGVDWGN
jgi:hypothetical protein